MYVGIIFQFYVTKTRRPNAIYTWITTGFKDIYVCNDEV